MPIGNITILRTTTIKNCQFNFFTTNLYEFEAVSEGTIEDSGNEMLQMDFANKYIGGGVLGQGCVQVFNNAHKFIPKILGRNTVFNLS